MKRTVKTSRAAGYLEKIFRTLNQDSFGGEVEEPIITIQSTKGAYGHVTVAKVWKKGDEVRHELNICADWLNRPIENDVFGLRKNKITYNGKRQWVYICYLSYWNKTYPCNKYDIYSITDR